MVTAKVALHTTTGLTLEVSAFLDDVKNLVFEEIVESVVDEEALRDVLSGKKVADEEMMKAVKASFEAIKEFMDKEELHRSKTARDGDGYIDFRDRMQLVADGTWVRNENVQKWKDSHSGGAPSR